MRSGTKNSCYFHLLAAALQQVNSRPVLSIEAKRQLCNSGRTIFHQYGL